MTTPTKDCGKPSGEHTGLDGRRLDLRQPDDRHERRRAAAQAEHGWRGVGGSACSSSVRLCLVGDRQEEVAVPHGLGDDEHGVERQRGDGCEGQLRRRRTPGPAAVVNVGSTRQSLASVATVASAAPVPSALKSTKAEPQRPEQQGQPQDAVDGDHHGGEDGVARQGRRLVTAREHQRDDERDLDDRDRHGEDEGAEGLTDPVGHDLGVVHGRQNGGGEQQRDDRRRRRRCPAPRGGQHDQRHRRHDPPDPRRRRPTPDPPSGPAPATCRSAASTTWTAASPGSSVRRRRG